MPKLLQSHFRALKNRINEMKKQKGSTKGKRRREIIFNDPKTHEIYKKLSAKEKELFRDLSSPDSFTSTRAIIDFVNLETKKINPMLRQLLKEPNPRIRSEAMLALSCLGEPKDIHSLSKQMYDPNPGVRYNAIEVFGGLAQNEPLGKKYLIERANNPMDVQTHKMFVKALSMAEINQHEIELYQHNSRRDSFKDPSNKIVRNRQIKDGSGTILLGGKLYGKATMRIIDKKALEAWKYAIENGIPVEPILKKNGEYRIYKNKDGTYRVSTEVLKGQSFFAFVRTQKNYKYLHEVGEQVFKIKLQLQRFGIDHRHFHPGNIVIRMEKGKPKAYLIDFDIARIKKYLPAH